MKNLEFSMKELRLSVPCTLFFASFCTLSPLRQLLFLSLTAASNPPLRARVDQLTLELFHALLQLPDYFQ